MKTSLMKRSKRPILRALGLSLLLPVSSSFAADISWTAGTGAFNDGANWDSGTVPTEADVAIISNSGTTQITEGDYTVQQIAPGRNGTGTVEISGGSLTTTIGPVRIGDDVDGTVNGNLGILEISGTGMFNVNAGSVLFGFEDPENEASDDSEGHLILSGDGQYNQTTGWFVLGKHGHGVMTISDNAEFRHTGGGNVNIGEHPTGSAEVTQSGGLLDTSGRELWVGNDGAVTTYNLSGGTVRTGNWTMIGRAGGNGTFNMTGGTINKTGGGNFIVGDNATGELKQSAGDISINGEFWVGQGDPGIGTYTLDGGTVSVNNWFAIGRSNAEGTLNINGGTITKTGNGNMELGNSANSVAVVNQTGGLVDVASWLEFGINGANSTYNLTGGTLQTAGRIVLNTPNGIETTKFNMSGADTKINISDWLAIGLGNGVATFTMEGGTITKTPDSPGNMAVGDWGGGEATFTQSGGVVNLNGSNLEIGKSDLVIGTVTLSGDAEFSAGVVSLTENSSQTATEYSSGYLHLTEDSVLSVDRIDGNLNDIAVPGDSHLYLNGGTLRANRDEPRFIADLYQIHLQEGGFNIDSNGFEITIPDPLLDEGDGSVTKLGAGTVHLDGRTLASEGYYNDIGGDITIQEGTLTIDANSIVDGVVTAADGAGFGVTVHGEGDTLSLSSLTLADTTAGNLDFDVGVFPASTTPSLEVGTLTANGEITVNVAGVLQTGLRPLMTYTTLNGTATFVMGALGPGIQAGLVHNVAEKTLYLDVTYAASLVWEGTVDGQWDFTTENWFDLGSSALKAFENGNPVVFNDEATGTTDIVLNTTVEPGSLAFTNNGPAPEGDDEAVDGLNYTLSGTGSIGGETDLVKSGTGDVTINTTNDYIGATLINEGSVTATVLADGGQASSIGAASADPENLVLGSGATFGYAGPDGATSNRGITFNGANTLDITNDLTLSGPFVFRQDGVLEVDGPASLTLTNAGEIPLGTRLDVNANLVLNGGDTQTVQVGEIWMGVLTEQDVSLTLNNTSLISNSWLAVGRGHSTTGNTATLTATNSSIQTGGFSAGYQGGLEEENNSNQVITLTDSTIDNNGGMNFAENNGSTSTMTLLGASSFTTSGDLWMARGANSTALITLGGTSSLTVENNRLAIGENGTGTMIVKEDAQLTVANGWFNVGQNDSGVGFLTVSDNAIVSVSGDFNVTDLFGGEATFTFEGGQVNAGNGTYVGKARETNGKVIMSGGTFTSTGNGDFQIGSSGTGTWTQTGGVVNARGWLAIGRHGPQAATETDPAYPAGTGLLDISGGEFHQTQEDRGFHVGENGIGTLTISGTALVTADGAAEGVVSDAAGIQPALQPGSVGTVNLNGGTLRTHKVRGGAGESTFNFDGGLLQASPNANIDFMHSLTSANILDGGANIDSNDQDIIIAQVLTGVGGLTKLGEGTLTLNGDNTYTGVTTVEAGGLGGTGAVGGDVTFTAGADFVVSGGVGTDGLTVGGTLDITGADLVSSAVLTEPSYVIATYGSLTGTFASVNVPGYLVEYGATQITLVVDPDAVQTYGLWVIAKGLDPETNGARTADPDSDGIENLLEFAMGTEPTAFDALPTATINGNVLELVYTRSITAASQVDLVVKHVNELVGLWSTEGVTDTSVEIIGTLETRKASVAIDGDARGFLRLEASEPVE